MKKAIVCVVAALAVLAATVGTAAAFRINGRSENSGLFRDLAVCTDGIQFDVGEYDAASLTPDPTQWPLGFIPPDPNSEALVMTTDLTLTSNPANASPLPVTPDTVLAEVFTVDPIANDDQYLIDSNLGVLPNHRVWLTTYERMWPSPLGVGTEIAVYNGSPAPDATEILTVTDCTIVEPPANPCDAPGAILGTDGKDLLIGTSGADVICGFDGKDVIIGLGGADLIYAGGGKDLVFGGRGADTIYGEGGRDTVFGGRGDDTIIGGPGHDALFGGPGNDSITQ